MHGKGYKSVKSLRDAQARGTDIPLTKLQLLGLKYYEDLLEKIPRVEVAEISEEVKKAVSKVFPGLKIKTETVGSFRRGKQMCGDVDVLITLDDDQSAKAMTLQDEKDEIKGMLPQIVDYLTKTGFLVERLGADRIAKTGSETHMGICKLQNKGALHRHIDIKVYPRSQYGFAVLYFTGSAAHNIKMRNDAISYGFSLSDAGLYHQSVEEKEKYQKRSPSMTILDPEVRKSLTKLASKKAFGRVATEHDIFQAFGMQYVQPCDRV